MAARQSSELHKYLTEAGELPRDVILGHIVLFTINDGEYKRDDVVQWFDELSLNPGFVPEPNKAIDAYKKATMDADDTDYPLPNDQQAHVLVRDVASNSEMVVRHLIREIRDGKRRRLAYGKIGEAVFYRPTVKGGKTVPGTERFRLTVDKAQLVADEQPAMTSMVEKITAQYERYVNFMDGMKVRAMVREYVKYLNAVALKQGVYFVHVSRQDELERLATLVDRLGHGSNMHLMPMVDLAEQRAKVISAFETEAEDALADVVKEIQHIRSTRKAVSGEAYAKVKGKYDLVITRAKEYTRTLHVSQDRTAGAAEIALEALAALQRQMLDGGTK